MKKKKLTEKQAWLIIAREFEKKHDTRFNKLGLCRAFTELWCDRLSDDAFYAMKDRVRQSKEFRKAVASRTSSFIWPVEPKFKHLRAKLARRFAKECK